LLQQTTDHDNIISVDVFYGWVVLFCERHHFFFVSSHIINNQPHDIHQQKTRIVSASWSKMFNYGSLFYTRKYTQ